MGYEQYMDPRPHRVTLHEYTQVLDERSDVEDALDALFATEWLHVEQISSDEWFVTLPEHVVEQHRSGNRVHLEVDGYTIDGVLEE